ncbi:hypothetical protein VT06_08510 [Arsukibacterium sp. MJ3]|uniref:META domain-containing protein n=1 Tax=Arsukibacterium sp. MJ3 TaxID=1632859 RepID=UPI0006273811|nr:META domain-containing protein [Arsukibacterium sp. MJ3]KKO49021.1 hypothetical protein VT06_08510 [Arsukibacterium sp. MJ3]
MRYPLTIVCSVMLLLGCQPAQQPSVALADTSQSALDWPGRYQGVIPCADCPGIKLTLQLSANQQYQLSRYYQEGAAEPEVSEGQFSWSSDGTKIQLDNTAASQFLVGEKQLLVLNPQGERIDGELAQRYRLAKQQSEEPLAAGEAQSLVGKWQLIELLQTTVDVDHQVFLQFDRSGRVNGYTGCNNLSGGYRLQGPTLSFTPLATTRKACQQDSIEPQLLDVLSKVDNISLTADELSLNQARMAPLARFSRVVE